MKVTKQIPVKVTFHDKNFIYISDVEQNSIL